MGGGPRGIPAPYPLNRRQRFISRSTPKADSDADWLENTTAEVLQRLSTTKLSNGRRIEIWRGEFTNPERSFWCIAAPERLPLGIHKCLEESAGSFAFGSSGDAFDRGLRPYALVSSGRIYLFDGNQPANTQRTVAVGKRRFAIKYLPYVWKERAEPESRALFPLSDAVETWSHKLTDSAIANWQVVQEHIDDLFELPQMFGNWKDLRAFCEDALRIKVIRLPMREHGRIILEPRRQTGPFGARTNRSDVYIALSTSLANKDLRVALAHELAHYIYHLNYYLFLTTSPWRVCHEPRVEHVLAAHLGSTWETYYFATEQRADWFASLFVVPPGIAEQVGNFKPDELETLWADGLRRDRSSLTATQREAENAHALRTADDMRGRPYSPNQGLADRIAWCVANRNNMDAAERWMTAERAIDTAYVQAARAMTSGQLPTTGRTFYRRITIDQAGEWLDSEDRWDPVVVEPTKGPASGYLGIRLMWWPDKNCPVERADWEQYPFVDGRAGFLSEWMAVAERKGWGLMLHAPNPTAKAIDDRESKREQFDAILEHIGKMEG